MNESTLYPLIFFHIPKNAGVSIRRILEIDTKMHPFNFSRTTNLGIDIKKYTDPEIFKSYYKFTVVRNPWDRMVSLYHFRKKENDLFMHNMSAGKVFGPDGTIWGFKKWILNSEIKAVKNNKVLFDLAEGKKPTKTKRTEGFLREHIDFINQLDIITDLDDNFLVDKILRFETLSEDWNRMLKYLKIHPIPQLPRKNYSGHIHYSDYYDDDLRDFVGALFRKDIEVFDYQFETPASGRKV
jgi:hypothetical protein